MSRRRAARPMLSRLGRAAYIALPARGRAMVRELAGIPTLIGGMSPFHGARRDGRNKDLPISPWRTDDELRNALRPLRAAARDMEINSEHTGWFLRSLKRHIIGPRGIRSRAMIRDSRGNLMTDLNQAVTAGFQEWASGPVTVDGRRTYVADSQLLIHNVARDGELLPQFVRDPKYRHGLALQSIDADQLDERLTRRAGLGGNEIRLGVEVEDRTALPLAFHLRESGFGTYPITITRERVAAFNPYTHDGDTLHLFMPRRVGQTRGPSWLHPVINKLHGLERYTESAIYAAEKASDIVGWLTPAEAEELWDTDALEGSTAADGKLKPRPEEIETEPGLILRGRPGDTVTTWKPEHPTTTHAMFRKAVLQDVGAGVDALHFQMGNDLEGVNYTSSRTGLLDVREVYRMLQQWWIDSYHRYVYETWIEQALLMGVIPPALGYNPRRYFPATHRGRGWDQVDPVKEWQGNALGIQLGGTTLTDILAERGEDLEEMLERRAHELKRAKEIGQKYGVTLTIEPPNGLGAEIALTYIQDALAAKGGAA